MTTARTLVYSALTSDTGLNTLGITADTCWAAASFDGPKDGPFMVLRWGVTVVGVGPMNSADLTMYVHDTGADYSRIDAILLSARAVMRSLVASGTPGNWLAGVEWLGDGGELNDSGYGTIVRTGDFRVTANTL